jgi:hypothetical protein
MAAIGDLLAKLSLTNEASDRWTTTDERSILDISKFEGPLKEIVVQHNMEAHTKQKENNDDAQEDKRSLPLR